MKPDPNKKELQKKFQTSKVPNVQHDKKTVVIVSPALASANNGNWQTAKRYGQFLKTQFRVRIVSEWDGSKSDDVLIALHARRSFSSIAAWHSIHGANGLVVVLTGTDLYRDIKHDPQAQQSLEFASRLIVLQPLGLDELPPHLRSKTEVVLQSTTPRVTLSKSSRDTRAVMVGHLREEKSPRTLFEAAALLGQQGHMQIQIKHIGAEHDQLLATMAHQTASSYPQYQFTGALSHAETRRQIQRSHVLVHTSVMEGGAHVLMEAVCSGVPVIASRIPGNMGMLGQDYAGLFSVGDAQALADMLVRFRHDSEFEQLLKKQCALLAPLFSPEYERKTLLTIIQSLISARHLS
jgi:putative glycosyltransferase (TIGR04348 family)